MTLFAIIVIAGIGVASIFVAGISLAVPPPGRPKNNQAVVTLTFFGVALLTFAIALAWGAL